MTWIPCAEQLSKPGDEVLMCIEGRPWVRCGVRGTDPGDWVYYGPDGAVPCFLIPTHWQPKPAAKPKAPTALYPLPGQPVAAVPDPVCPRCGDPRSLCEESADGRRGQGCTYVWPPKAKPAPVLRLTAPQQKIVALARAERLSAHIAYCSSQRGTQNGGPKYHGLIRSLGQLVKRGVLEWTDAGRYTVLTDTPSTQPAPMDPTP